MEPYENGENGFGMDGSNNITPHLFIGIMYGEEEGAPIQRPYSLEVTQIQYIHKPNLEFVRLSCLNIHRISV